MKLTEKQTNLMKLLQQTQDKKNIYEQLDREKAYHTARSLSKKGLVEIKQSTIELTESGTKAITVEAE